jgi:Tol biopolymer transport system component
MERPAAQQTRYRLRQLTFDDGLSFEPSLSQDGNLLAYSSDVSGRGDLDIWVRQVTGGNPIRLTDHPADDRQPDISPDGSRVAFRSDRDGGGIYVGPALGGEAVLVVGTKPGGEGPHTSRFSPDGERLAYWVGSELLHPRAARNHAFVVSATGGEPHQNRREPPFGSIADLVSRRRVAARPWRGWR